VQTAAGGLDSGADPAPLQRGRDRHVALLGKIGEHVTHPVNSTSAHQGLLPKDVACRSAQALASIDYPQARVLHLQASGAYISQKTTAHLGVLAPAFLNAENMLLRLSINA
jgi:hypothetical protein